MPDLRGALVFIHVASVLLFVLVHGASAVIAFRLRSERDPARVAALLDTSRVALRSWPFIVGGLGWLISGIWLAFLGGYWNKGWLWASIAVLVVIIIGMTPMGTIRLGRTRQAFGLDAGPSGDAPAADAEAAQRELSAWNPMPVALLGGIGLLVVLYLMMLKPF